jgi:hypothetical protein
MVIASNTKNAIITGIYSSYLSAAILLYTNDTGSLETGTEFSSF